MCQLPPTGSVHPSLLQASEARRPRNGVVACLVLLASQCVSGAGLHRPQPLPSLRRQLQQISSSSYGYGSYASPPTYGVQSAAAPTLHCSAQVRACWRLSCPHLLYCEALPWQFCRQPCVLCGQPAQERLPFDFGAFLTFVCHCCWVTSLTLQACAAPAGAMILPPPVPQTPMAYGTPAPVVYGQTAQPPAPAVQGFTQAAPSTVPAAPVAYGTPPSPAPAVYGTPAMASPAVKPFSTASPPAPLAMAYGTPPTQAPPSYSSTSPAVTPAVKSMATPPAASSPAPGEHI